MSAGAHNLYDILHFQIVEQSISEFEEIDGNNDGLWSIQEVSVLPLIQRDAFIENSTGDWMWKTGVDPNGDGYISLVDEMLPLWNQIFEYLTTAEYPGSIWYQSHFALENNLEIIGNVTAGILILQGEEDTQTPVFEAHFLDQRLMEVGHQDHTLITYPGLGHSFYPKEGLLQWLGPIQDHVLSDLATWLKDPERGRFLLVEQLQTASNTINELQGQLNDLKSEFNQQTSELENQVSELQSESTGMHNTVTELKSQNMELQSALDSAKNMTYIALGAALIAVIFGAVIMFQNRNRS
jgi:esterase/lipase